jgi:hypothetical protein
MRSCIGETNNRAAAVGAASAGVFLSGRCVGFGGAGVLCDGLGDGFVVRAGRGRGGDG